MTLEIKYPEPMTIYIDNNVWDFLFERDLVLCDALPPPEFRLKITREAEFEIPPIPDDKKRSFISMTIKNCNIETHRYFGFSRYDDVHSNDEQRIGGFGLGHWASSVELDFIRRQQEKMGTVKKQSTRLYKNEADISLAARSLNSNTVVLTLDKGAIFNDAILEGGKVIYLADFKNSQISLKDYVLGKLAEMASG
jgi:hypothetical protein